jgi:hypothetical protein
MAYNPREAILDNILGGDHVGLTMLYYSKRLLRGNDYLEMAVSLNNYGRIFVEGAFVVIG